MALYPWAMIGFCNVNKPPGPTSHDIVAGVRKRLPRGTKVGHAGTLDPFAEGVLVLCIGGATRLAQYAQAGEKRYRAQVTLGATSTTDDLLGEISPREAPTEFPTRDAVEDAIRAFVGVIRQSPPAHSAVHVDGQRAYKLARRGEAVQLPAREVSIQSIEVLRYEFPLLELDVRCESGTYIRALARDLGNALGVGGYCSALCRTAVGPFRIEASVAPDALRVEEHLLSPLVGLWALPRIVADPAAAARIANGRTVLLSAPPDAAGEIAILDSRDALLAIGRLLEDGRTLQPVKVFAECGTG